MKRFFLLLLTMTLLGCEGIGSTQEARQSLLIAGSSTMLPLAEALSQAFAARHGQIDVICEGGGSTAGIVALQRGGIDIALMSRDVRPREDSTYLRCLPYARNGIGLVVHASNPVREISVPQARMLLTGEYSNWQQTGGQAGKIHVISRAKGSTTLQGVNDIILHGEDMAPDAVTAASAAALVQKVGADTQAVGFVSYADMQELPAELLAAVKLLSVEGVAMQRETILSGRYPLTRQLFFAVRHASPATQAFLDFCLGPEGMKITREAGLLTVH
ncbi:MAG: phosphate ABC transporter substrate-binding protein [Desulfovibrio sp.]|nr:phosphate ABC transporter substrate-binding protein [Desulfovibrio sp.]